MDRTAVTAKRDMRSLTLLELMIALILFLLVAAGFYQLQTFTQQGVLIADRRSRVQNEVSFILEHMTKNIKNAIGNTATGGGSSDVIVTQSPPATPERLSVYIDGNGDGVRQTPVVNPAANQDRWISYDRPAGTSDLRFCGRCQTNANCASCLDTRETLSRRITVFNPVYTAGNNFVDVTITGRFNPTLPAGTSDNPQVQMQAGISMPGVSTN